jgi:hypothetical protein
MQRSQERKKDAVIDELQMGKNKRITNIGFESQMWPGRPGSSEHIICSLLHKTGKK